VADELDGPEMTWATMPLVSDPAETPRIEELVVDAQARPHAFWQNLEYRPLTWLSPDEWATRVDSAAEFRAWYRFVPTSVFEDPYLEAARVAMLVDISGWPALVRALAPEDEARWIAPNLDLAMTFHASPEGAEHLLLDGFASTAAGGLAAGGGAVWSPDGRLLGSGTQQLIFRRLPT
jgi:acyl-CoA thioesterase